MIDRPWMTALEKQCAALKGCLFVRGQLQETWADSTYQLLRQADCFAWTQETAMAIVFAAKTVPDTTTFQRAVLPSASGWWWFDVPLPLRINPEVPSCQAMLWGPTDDNGIELAFFSVVPWFDISPAPISKMQLYDGQTLNAVLSAVRQDDDPYFDENELHAAVQLLRVFLAGCIWLEQRIVTVSRGHVERHHRKQLARESNMPMPSDIKVIQLRRLESAPRPPSTCSESTEWSCRWIVNGHWRHQVYAHDERKLIYIMPFVKGPADKPLRVPTHTVYQVSR